MTDEPASLDDDDALQASDAADTLAFAEKLEALRKRCEAAKIEYNEATDEDGDRFATILIQSGRGKRQVAVYSARRADELLKIPFEKYRFLLGFEAVCSYEDHLIEAGLRSNRLPANFILGRLLKQLYGAEAEGKVKFELNPPEALGLRPVIEIGPSSSEFKALCGIRGSRVTLKLIGARAAQHDQAINELLSYADSLFFQFDVVRGATFILERQRRTRLTPSSRRPTAAEVEYPTARYNNEAMSLYWYARTAGDMPLLKYLAFYQSIEFFFPRYSQIEARKRVSLILKQPTFRVHRDDDIDQLMSAIRVAKTGGFGSERQQLRSVLSECIGQDEVRSYLTAFKEREGHFSGRGGKSRYHKIPIASKAADLRNDLADRIYDIRCKIVHTKNDQVEEEIPMILPFSEDAHYLIHDIDLIEFVARSVLTASSEELH